MRMTQFRPADNNPLKFSANVDDALHNLLVKRNRGLSRSGRGVRGRVRRPAQPPDRDARRACASRSKSMLAEFDPDRLQEQFDRQLEQGSLLAVPAKLRYWDLFRERRDEMRQGPRGQLPPACSARSSRGPTKSS